MVLLFNNRIAFFLLGIFFFLGSSSSFLYGFNRFTIKNGSSSVSLPIKPIKKEKPRVILSTSSLDLASVAKKKIKKTVGNPHIKKNCEKKILNFVRILLGQSSEDKEWELMSQNGFLLYTNPQNSPQFIAKKSLKIQYKKNKLYIEGKNPSTFWLLIKPIQEHFNLEKINYHGSLLLINNNNKIFLINSLKLEDYIFSVLRTESWPGWPLEVNKVFAITSRTYALRMMSEARRKKRFYDLKNSNVHQTYRGIHNCSVIRKAVEQTKGIILTFNKIPILAMFDCCCGSIIPAHIEEFDFFKAPYLARNYACFYCKKCKIYSWKVKYTLDEFALRLTKIINPSKKIDNVTIMLKDKAGLVQRVAITTMNGEKKISGKELYSCLKEVKSFYFSIKKSKKEVELTGRGYGHHLGLCQWGAREMVRDGYSYKKILQFYYPGTQLSELG